MRNARKQRDRQRMWTRTHNASIAARQKANEERRREAAIAATMGVDRLLRRMEAKG